MKRIMAVFILVEVVLFAIGFLFLTHQISDQIKEISNRPIVIITP
jgi:hypothetical protein